MLPTRSPAPRSAHQAAIVKSSMYVFGGEFTSPNQERFHHFKVRVTVMMIHTSIVVNATMMAHKMLSSILQICLLPPLQGLRVWPG